jgi:glyoxylase-like metal-dependent hydrolase (beta-lactamase superfamily II)
MERRVYSVLGNAQKLDGGAMFGNAPKALWQEWSPPDQQNRIDLACRALLIREPARSILFETGIGAFFEPKLRARYGVVEARHVLLEELSAIGLAPEQIAVVVLSHLHFDHAGGLLAQYEEGQPLRLAFPKARFVVGKTAWERAIAPHARDRASFIPELQVLLQESGRLEIVDGETSSTLGPSYRFHYSHGHTPGMMLAEIPGDRGPIFFCGDLIPGLPWVRRAITMGYDRFPELLIDEKTEVLERMLEKNGRLFYTHDPKFAMSRLARDGKGQIVPIEPIGSVKDELA